MQPQTTKTEAALRYKKQSFEKTHPPKFPELAWWHSTSSRKLWCVKTSLLKTTWRAQESQEGLHKSVEAVPEAGKELCTEGTALPGLHLCLTHMPLHSPLCMSLVLCKKGCSEVWTHAQVYLTALAGHSCLHENIGVLHWKWILHSSAAFPWKSHNPPVLCSLQIPPAHFGLCISVTQALQRPWVFCFALELCSSWHFLLCSPRAAPAGTIWPGWLSAYQPLPSHSRAHLLLNSSHLCTPTWNTKENNAEKYRFQMHWACQHC